MEIIQKTLNYLKSLTAETISHAGSGHTGSALGASSIALALFHDHLKFDASGNHWLGRDRFVLSAGHASALLYAISHLFGYDISISDLKNFRVCHSKTPGHPEYGVVPSAETTTGPLGQGIANAVGMAIAQEMLSARLGDGLLDGKIYCYVGDGCLMEGVGNEACSIAGTLKLSNLIVLYDDNHITIDGEVSIANREDVKKKFEAMGWNVILQPNGNDYSACSRSIGEAKNSDKPTIIIFKTTIGIGTEKQGTNAVHAMPLSAEALEKFKASLGVRENFFVPQDVYDFCHEATNKNNKLIEKWNEKVVKNAKFNEFKQILMQKMPNFDKILQNLKFDSKVSGRDASGIILNELAKFFPLFVGGTADLSPSTKAYITGGGDFSAENRLGKNIHFGIREHAMGAITNGIALFGGLSVFDSTFLAFSNYMIPPLRMRAMMNVPVLSVFTHDSIDIGQDGPTHQPIEQLPQLRQIVGLNVFRPATVSEIFAAYEYFFAKREPVALVLTKSSVISTPDNFKEKALRGGYVYFETAKKPTIQIFATGRELALALQVVSKLNEGVRVISMPSVGLFEKQDKKYQNSVLLSAPKLSIAIEASNDNIWYKFVRNGLIININSYQTSGNGDEVYREAGFEAEKIVKKIKKFMASNNLQ